MAFPARFATVKSPPELYEQRLKDLGTYSEGTISSLLEKAAAVDVEGSDVVVVNDGAQADAATILEDFIYGKEGQEGQEGQEEEAAAPETNGDKTGEGEDREMKEGAENEEETKEGEGGVDEEPKESSVSEEPMEGGGVSEEAEESGLSEETKEGGADQGMEGVEQEKREEAPTNA